MSRRRKDALAKIASYIPDMQRHLDRILANPEHSSRNKWKSEALGWILQMEALIPHVGKKTAAEWQARIARWRASLEDLPRTE